MYVHSRSSNCCVLILISSLQWSFSWCMSHNASKVRVNTNMYVSSWTKVLWKWFCWPASDLKLILYYIILSISYLITHISNFSNSANKDSEYLSVLHDCSMYHFFKICLSAFQQFCSQANKRGNAVDPIPITAIAHHGICNFYARCKIKLVRAIVE